MFGEQMLLGSILVILSVILHVMALVTLARILARIAQRELFQPGTHSTVIILAAVVLGIVGIHTVEAWVWASVYLLLGEFDDLSQALYFSVVTSTTLGYGDLILSSRWQLLGTFEAMGGLILFGTSTAFLISCMRRMLEPLLPGNPAAAQGAMKRRATD